MSRAMSATFLRRALLVLLGLLLAATFFALQVRDMRRALSEAEGGRTESMGPLPVLGRVPDFALTGHDGSTVRLGDLAGAPWVADFVFTRCALTCPRLTPIMRRLGADAPGVARVSISVDPEHDTPEVLADYARSHAVSDPVWRFLTGPTEAVEALVIGGFMLPVTRDAPPGLATPDEPILHSNRFVLVDGEGAIRGYYEVTEEGEYRNLLRDLRRLGAAAEVR